MMTRALALAALPAHAALAPTPATAQTDPEVLAIIDEVDRLMRGESSTGRMRMEIDTENWSRSLEMQVWSLGTEYSLIRVESPPREAGTATPSAPRGSSARGDNETTMVRRTATWRWTAVLTFGLVACSAGDPPPTVVRSDSAGVEIARSSGPLPILDLAADTALVFGGEESGPASFYQVRPALVDVDQEGLIYLLDRIQHQVLVFAPVGQLVATWGRRGEGPGELSAPLSVTASNGTATVHDAGRALFVSYAADGEIVERSAPPSVIHMWFGHVQALPDRLAFWDRDVFTVTENRRDRLLSVRGADTVSLVESRPAYSSTAYHPRCSARFTIAMPLSPHIHWSQWENRVVVVAGPDFQVDWFDGARLVRRSTFGEPAPELSAREVVALLEARGVRGPCNSSPREYIQRHGYFPKPQAVSAVTLHPNGGLWVQHEDLSGNDRIVVFDSTAAPLGVLKAEFPMPIVFLPDGRALIQVVDSVDVERIGILDMIPGEG